MATDNEKLWVVTRYRIFPDGSTGDSVPFKVFRTRAAATKYVKAMRLRARRFGYLADGIAWGPEQ